MRNLFAWLTGLLSPWRRYQAAEWQAAEHNPGFPNCHCGCKSGTGGRADGGW